MHFLTRAFNLDKLPLLKRLGRSPSGRLGLILLLSLVLLAVSAPWLNPYEPTTARNYATRLSPPSATFWFGADELGRDLLTLVWYGLRTSLEISVASVLLGGTLGVSLGLIAGYYRGVLERVIGWLTDVMLSFPSILLAIALVSIRGPSFRSVMLAIGAVQVPKFIRLTRSMALSLREQPFVEAGRAFGARPWRLMLYYVLPACLSPIVIQATLALGTATLEAAGLGFLGLGVQPPTPELGTLLANAFKGGYSISAPWTILFPGGCITLVVLAFNLLGDGLQDALDVQNQ